MEPIADKLRCSFKHNDSAVHIMNLMDLPFTIVEAICFEACYSQDLIRLSSMREVNRFFEEIATKVIARKWLCSLRRYRLMAIPQAFKQRLINNLIGEFDRRSNKFASYYHKVADYLTDHMTDTRSLEPREIRRAKWVRVVCLALGRGELFSSGNGITPLCKYPVSNLDGISVRASAFLVLLISRKADVETLISRKECSPVDKCPYLGAPLETTCRLGYLDTTRSLLRAGATDYLHPTPRIPSYLDVAASSNHAQVVKALLLESSAKSKQIYTENHIKKVMDRAARHGAREALRMIIDVQPHARRVSMSIVGQVARRGWDDILKSMIEAGAETESHGTWDVFQDAIFGGHFSTCKLLNSYGIPKDFGTERSAKYCRRAAAGDSVEILQYVERHCPEEVTPGPLSSSSLQAKGKEKRWTTQYLETIIRNTKSL